MNYRTIINTPDEREKMFYSWCYYDDAFTEEELNKMCDYFETHGTEKGSIVGSDCDINDSNENGEVVDERIRKSDIKFYQYISDHDVRWIFERLNYVIDNINQQYYNFILNGYDHFQYTEYESSEMGHYDYHSDLIYDKITNFSFRKLSLTLTLNEPEKDFEGGEFLINTATEKNSMVIPQKRGRIILFPSFMLHRVNPVTKGKRKSLVVWVTGPKFR